MIKPHEHDDKVLPLGDPRMLAACGVTAKRALLTARARSRARIVAGSDEIPFPDPVDHVSGAAHYRVREVREWKAKHTWGDNPSRRPPDEPDPD